MKLGTMFATRNKCIASSNKCLTSSNKKPLGAKGIATRNQHESTELLTALAALTSEGKRHHDYAKSQRLVGTDRHQRLVPPSCQGLVDGVHP